MIRLKLHPRRVWLFAPAGLFLTLDVTFTLIGQPASYWAGDRPTANEANPIAYWLLAANPWLFAASAAVWAVLLGVVITLWNSRLTNALAMVVAVAHAFGGSSWLLHTGDWGLAFAGGYLVLAAQFCFWCWGKGTGSQILNYS